MPDSGYSVDNLSPCTPAALAAEYIGSSQLHLHWNPNTETDLHHYAIYRGAGPDFVPDETNCLGTATDTPFVDGGFGYSEEYYYKVSALDFNGLEGPFSLLTPDMITGAPGVRRDYANVLLQSAPNPFLLSTRIAFSIKEAGHVRLSVFDAQGDSHGSWLTNLVTRIAISRAGTEETDTGDVCHQERISTFWRSQAGAIQRR